ncbi:predicted protein [Naegleria gruberi]|uniref:Predicted protein n=1 Tax=Naegleria gruberi TaxID=5762 RepID=D2VP94_NAEGR|nr:uncharacterized protein NAEGRDRAFT_70775 [Naegleria gruberi]EFC41320.1 predicted protein [Naegleria gruberi]|eukprot:XP_002674064.1 predicted protein [Naegleria gruberi strain NEG-M]
MKQPEVNFEEQPVVLSLDVTFSSPLLKSTIDNQRKLHENWCKEADLFRNAIITPLEYCVREESRFGKRKQEYSPYVIKGQEFIYMKKLKNLSEDMEECSTTNERYDSPVRDGVEQSKKKKRFYCEQVDSLEAIPIELRNSKEYMMERVKKNGLYLHYAHPRLLFDQELLLEAIRNNGDAFKYVPFTFRKDEEFLKRALELNGDAFMFLHGEMRKRKDLFDSAIITSGRAFEHADNSIRTGYFNAVQAVSKYWSNLSH